jgi:hypothetical protein
MAPVISTVIYPVEVDGNVTGLAQSPDHGSAAG